MAEEDQEEDPMQAEYKHNVATLEAGNDDEELWNAPYRETLFSEDYYPVEMFNAGSNVGSMSQKRKTWMQEANGNMTKFANLVARDQAEAMKLSDREEEERLALQRTLKTVRQSREAR
ncbi:hypothetical protein Bca101_005128 [Brassica carinata]